MTKEQVFYSWMVQFSNCWMKKKDKVYMAEYVVNWVKIPRAKHKLDLNIYMHGYN